MAKKKQPDGTEIETDEAANPALEASGSQPDPAPLEAPEPKEGKGKKASTEGLVKMHKNGESIHVHPTTVASHQSAGWETV